MLEDSGGGFVPGKTRKRPNRANKGTQFMRAMDRGVRPAKPHVRPRLPAPKPRAYFYKYSDGTRSVWNVTVYGNETLNNFLFRSERAMRRMFPRAQGKKKVLELDPKTFEKYFAEHLKLMTAEFVAWSK